MQVKKRNKMKILSYIPDYRIQALNVSIEINSKEYIEIAKDIIDLNEFQRKKVINSRLKKTLKTDLLKKCTIPPIVLGVKDNFVPKDFDFTSFKNDTVIIKIIEEKSIIILDGLQRTYVMLELYEADPKADWLKQNIRCEIYVGLEKLGILYRMLTLNTGQTTMSTRHLLEILYFDYLSIELPGKVKLFLDKDEQQITNPLLEYKFKDIIQGYTSFINGREVPTDRADILQNIETLESLERTDNEKEGFKSFLTLFTLILNHLNETIDFNYDADFVKSSVYKIQSNPFGKDIVSIIGKSQSLTGLGATLKFLKEKRDLNFEDILKIIPTIPKEDNETIYSLLSSFEYIKNNSKKVGNDQRLYFKILFRNLLDKESESFKNLKESIRLAGNRIEERLEF